MNQLDNLHDIHLPEPVSFWPPAIGWWILLAIIIVLLVTAIAAFLYWHKHKRYKRKALHQLDALYDMHHEDNAFTEATARLIKQTALVKHPEVASLQGESWQHFLADAMPEDIAHEIAVGRYRNSESIDRDKLYQATKQWIRGQK